MHFAGNGKQILFSDSQPCDSILQNFGGMTFQNLQAAVAAEVFQDGTQASGVTMASLFTNSTPSNQQAAAAQPLSQMAAGTGYFL
jgi:hypothetical protein